MTNILRSKKGQGTTEYIVILSIAILFLVTVFWGRIRPILEQKVQGISSSIQQAR